MADIFISYTREEESFVANLYEALSKYAQSAWIELELTTPTLNRWATITQNIASAKHFIIIMSPHSMSSPLCHLEIECAYSLSKHIIPILYADYERDACITGIVNQLSMFRHLWGTRQSIRVFDENHQILDTYFRFSREDDFNPKFEQLMEIIRTNHHQFKYRKAKPTPFSRIIKRKFTDGMEQKKSLLAQVRHSFFVFVIASFVFAFFNLLGTLSNTKGIDSYNRGENYLNSGNYNRAISEFNEALQLNPELAEAYLNRGFAYLNLGNTDKALSDFNHALELNPELAEAYTNLARLYGQLGDYDKAFENANHAIELNPELAGAYINRGLAYWHLGDTNKALVDLNRAIELDSELPDSYVDRGLLYLALEEPNKALIDLNRAIELDSELAVAYINRGLAYYMLAEIETNSNKKREYIQQSLDDFQKAQSLGLELKPIVIEIINQLEAEIESIPTPTPTPIIFVPTVDTESAEK